MAGGRPVYSRKLAEVHLARSSQGGEAEFRIDWHRVALPIIQQPLPEDRANRQIANGFQMALDWQVQGRIQVLPEAGGWSKVLDVFESDHIRAMDNNGNSRIW